MKENADYDFLSKIETSILERIETSTEENLDRAAIVNAELFYIEPFKDEKFYDENLKALALKYIEGLNIQKDSLKKEFEYEYQIGWQKGLVMRYEVLNELYENYDLLKDNSKFVAIYISGLNDEKAFLTAFEEIEMDLSSQKGMTDDTYWKYDGTYLTCTFKNNTKYSYGTVWEITYFDANETIVGNESTLVENIKPGNSYVVSFYVPNPDETDHYAFNNYYTDVKLR